MPSAMRLREMGESARKFTNVYVKNFGDDISDESLREMFEKHGTVLSHKVMFDETGKSRGFGFVAFENPEDAEKVVILWISYLKFLSHCVCHLRLSKN